MKQSATSSNKPEVVAPIDMTYGYPGELPQGRTQEESERLHRFFELYASGMNARAAARKAGFGEKWAKVYSYQWLKRYADFVTWLQAHVAQTNAGQLAIEQSDVLNQIALIGMANEFDYLVFEPKGKKVKVRRKRLDELTREQMVAIDVVLNAKHEPTHYRFRDRDGKLFELGKSLGMFNEKVILEHRHRHLHVSADLSKVPMAVLEKFEESFEQMLLTHEGPTDAESRLPAVRGDQGQKPQGGNGTGRGQDQRSENHQQPRGRRASKSPKS